MSKFTPLHISLMIHYYVIPAKKDNQDSTAGLEYTKDLLDLELIEEDKGNESGYDATDKGKAFIKAICSTEIPILAWVDKDNNILLKE